MALEINGSSSLLKLTRIKRRSNFLTIQNSCKVFSLRVLSNTVIGHENFQKGFFCLEYQLVPGLSLPSPLTLFISKQLKIPFSIFCLNFHNLNFLRFFGIPALFPRRHFLLCLWNCRFSALFDPRRPF